MLPLYVSVCVCVCTRFLFIYRSTLERDQTSAIPNNYVISYVLELIISALYILTKLQYTTAFLL